MQSSKEATALDSLIFVLFLQPARLWEETKVEESSGSSKSMATFDSWLFSLFSSE
jgi:hypothetical protein